MHDSAVPGILGSPPVRLRPYTSEEAQATLEVFTAAVTVTAAVDYTPEQLAAWAGGGTRVPPARSRGRGRTRADDASASASASASAGAGAGAGAGDADVDEGGPRVRPLPDPPLARDLEEWDGARRSARTVVAVVEDRAQHQTSGGIVVGFAGLTGTGHIDMLFVAPAHGRRGIATALLRRLSEIAGAQGADELTADVSLTARPFFEANGFRVLAEQHPVRNGVRLVNHRMVRELRGVNGT
ncbi:MAG: GNAT family N-acetyltransferase [Pauljensenia sp.]